MKTLAMILSGLALVASAAATIYLFFAPFYQGIITVQTESGVQTIQVTKTVVQVNGSRAIILLVGATLISSVPFLVAFARPSLQRLVTGVCALLLLAFSIAGSLTIGLAFMPSAILLLVAGIVSLFIRKDAAQSDGG